MLKVTLAVGIPGSGKSTWAKEEVRKDPEGTVRICRDDLRNMLSNYHFSDSNEKMVTETKNFLLAHSLKKGRNVILDETNINRRNFEDVCEIVKKLNIDCVVMEKSFFVDLDEAINRDSQRIGSAKVGEDVVRRFWKKSGGNQHKFYKPRVEIITRDSNKSEALKMNPKLPTAVLCDLDGTLALLNGRNPYDASTCEDDVPNIPVIESLKLYYKAGYKIIFCSGREDKYEAQTRTFIETYCTIDNFDTPRDRDWIPITKPIEYKLYMRKSNDFRKDAIIKEEIFESKIRDKYNVLLVLDDRTQVCELWRDKLGLTCFQVAPGDF